jgi:hypothetical protein
MALERARRQKIITCISICVAIMAVSWVVMSGPSEADRAAERERISIYKLIAVGMDIDEAADRLIDAGVTGVGKKHQPTGSYWLVIVTIRTDYTWLDNLDYATGWNLLPDKKMHVVIEADESGKITEID